MPTLNGNRIKKHGRAQKASIPEPIAKPELIIGLVGPIGVNLDAVAASLIKTLGELGYSADTIRLTDVMVHKRVKTKKDETSYFGKYKSLITYANEFRKLAKTDDAMAGLAVAEIRRHRSTRSGDPNRPALGHAYIVRQFKRPEEIALMRRVYGRKFVQVSVYGSAPDRRKVLMDKISSYDASPKSDADKERQAIELIDIDHNQVDVENGQRLADVFHHGDVFVNGIDSDLAEKTVRRFVRAFFGDNASSPTIDEYGLYMAAAASLRSVDLSRQVGAAIFGASGDIVALGCNEVPKPGGGNYWSDDEHNSSRDIDRGTDANHERKVEIIYDLTTRLSDLGFLSREMMAIRDMKYRVKKMLSEPAIKQSQVMDIIEFGRIIHAEMNALTDAARLGRATKEAVLYCTTFPCHMCAKHIVAAGISRVVFLEPYPKSYAYKLHEDAISLEPCADGRVQFDPFIGISPRRYRDIFEKKTRKDKSGKAREWYHLEPMPLIEDKSAAYIENEEPEIFISLRNLRSKSSVSTPTPAPPSPQDSSRRSAAGRR